MTNALARLRVRIKQPSVLDVVSHASVVGGKSPVGFKAGVLRAAGRLPLEVRHRLAQSCFVVRSGTGIVSTQQFHDGIRIGLRSLTHKGWGLTPRSV